MSPKNCGALGGQARGQPPLGIGFVPGVGQLAVGEGTAPAAGQERRHVGDGKDFDRLRDDVVTLLGGHTPV